MLTKGHLLWYDVFIPVARKVKEIDLPHDMIVATHGQSFGFLGSRD